MNVYWLGHEACNNSSLVGGKAANLSRLYSHNRVPTAFCLSALSEEVEPMMQAIQAPDRAETTPNELLDIISQPYRELSGRIGGGEIGVAVRSSSSEEDAEEVSFAGQHETFLNVVGIEAVARAIIRCFASFFSTRAVAYRTKKGVTTNEPRLAVIIQQQILADVSAVIFSANPATGDRSEIVINVSWGQGESVVSGAVTPDLYTVRKPDLIILSRQISEKRLMTVPSNTGTKQVDVPRIMQKEPCVTDKQVQEMAQLTLVLEKSQGWPVDVECAYQGSSLYLLQCRPITTLDRSNRNS